MARHILALDQGTTSTRAILFDAEGDVVASAQRELQQFFPADGRVEHDPEHIWADSVAVCREALERAGLGAHEVAGLGITNQRETAILWERASGRPVHNAIVWQDRRTAPLCRELVADGLEEHVAATTGLVIDAYFSATKLAWLLDHVPGARARAERGELAFGTVDSFLLWRLTGGAVHATDVTNASRTSLFDIPEMRWDAELCRLFGVPQTLLPQGHDNSHLFGSTAPGLFDAQIPIAGMAGDQQAALFGQACFERGMAKSTYGTGCFMLLNTGAEAVESQHQLLTTPAYRLNGNTTYALEGSIFVAGAAVKWLRDGIGVIRSAGETEELASSVPDDHGLYLVPAFVGLGAPYWDPDARGAIFGLTLDATVTHLTRAALEAVAYQSLDLAEAMAADGAAKPAALRVDGGMAANAWLCQFLADILDCPVERPQCLETTALGAAFHAGLATGVWPDLAALSNIWARQDSFEPSMDAARRQSLLAGWKAAVGRVLTNQLWDCRNFDSI